MRHERRQRCGHARAQAADERAARRGAAGSSGTTNASNSLGAPSAGEVATTARRRTPGCRAIAISTSPGSTR
ncbi:hypothetical protein VU09_15445 [Burkholderia pseudomallei]|nr:hypothetical protein VP95_07745 [Burkholderia pseudomallei]KKI74854.1 hypothetical protein VU09_15445 [Burkholderia pseudomallei]ONC74955.1 hypothetical protein AQ922_09820 [Burkholderia pseudomallei]OND57234.1 hypothetical protein AQ936_17515 [Burkholderia pseudomallei]OND81250.1 hypothetical protein AQ939_26055 [Burkholderia pseudomallei]